MLSSLAKYDKVAQLKHVESKKQLFARGVYGASPGHLLHPALIGGWRGRGWKGGWEKGWERGWAKEAAVAESQAVALLRTLE